MASLTKADSDPRAALVRCPACGHKLDEPTPPKCPLCHVDFGDDRITGLDVSPYAKAYARDAHGWHGMCEWVWFARTERLKHLALMRSSAASRRFRRINIFVLSLSLAAFEMTRSGWRWVRASPALEPTGSRTPGGHFWMHAAQAPRPLPLDQPEEAFVDIWWNPVQAMIASAAAFLAALLLLAVALAILRRFTDKAHLPAYRGEGRLSAAQDYGTAWLVPVLVAALIATLRPISYVGAMNGWSWSPPRSVFELSAAIVAAFAGILWWFWLIRLGATAPPKTRGRLVTYFALMTPIVFACAITAWWVGIPALCRPLFGYLELRF